MAEEKKNQTSLGSLLILVAHKTINLQRIKNKEAEIEKNYLETCANLKTWASKMNKEHNGLWDRLFKYYPSTSLVIPGFCHNYTMIVEKDASICSLGVDIDHTFKQQISKSLATEEGILNSILYSTKHSRDIPGLIRCAD